MATSQSILTSHPIMGSRVETDFSDLYWNKNLPREEWTIECPDFLANLSSKDIGILSRQDKDCIKFTWDQVKELASKNHVHRFERNSSSLRAYREYMHYLKQKYGSVLAFIQFERLKWDDVTASGDKHFSNASDFKVVYNDWPYHIDEQIVHLIVWTKWAIDEVPITEEVTLEAKAEIEQFILKTFCRDEMNDDGQVKVDRDQVVWFKNWKSSKSVHALEHFHVMIYQAPRELLAKVTNGDRPVSETWIR